MSEEGHTDIKMKICLLGDGGVGKTSLVYRFIQNRFSTDFKSTLGVNLLKHEVIIENIRITAQIWDLGGQDKYEGLRKLYLDGSQGALVVFDLTRYTTFSPNILKWIKDLWSFTGRIPIVLLGNKVDLEIMRSVRTKDAEKFADKVPCPYIETSAKEGQGVEKAFKELAKYAFEFWNKTNNPS